MTFLAPSRMLLNNRQFVQCAFLSPAEEERLREDTAQKGYSLVEADLVNIQSSEELIQRMASALNFPSYFGGNWDAFLDMATDLSWNPAPGYVLFLKNAEALVQLPSEQIATFVRLCLAVVGRWQSGEDEEGNTIPRTPFYFLLQGQAPFCRLVTDLLALGRGS